MRNWIDSKAAQQDIVINSRVRLARNIETCLFTDKMKVEDAIENINRIYEIIEKKYDGTLNLVRVCDNSHRFMKTYVEKHLISDELLKRKDRGAFIINEENTLSIMINEVDHLRIQCITDGLDLKSAFKMANEIDDLIEEDETYAFHEDFGYLTAEPTNVGTGMRASVMIHLPALSISEEINNISKSLSQLGMSITPVYVEGSKSYGNIFEISNQITLGVNEEEIISNLEGVVFNIISEEKKFREVLICKQRDEVEDKIFRAYGILKCAKIISSKEILDLLSSVRLGVEMSIINIEKKVLNKLLIDTKDSILQERLGKDLNTKEKNIERAKIVQEVLL